MIWPGRPDHDIEGWDLFSKNSGSCVQKVHLFLCHSYFLDSYNLMNKVDSVQEASLKPGLAEVHTLFFLYEITQQAGSLVLIAYRV